MNKVLLHIAEWSGKGFMALLWLIIALAVILFVAIPYCVYWLISCKWIDKKVIMND